MRAFGMFVAVAFTVGGCSLLFNGNDLKGTNANGDMSAGGSGGSGGGDDMAGGGGAGGGGGGGTTGPLTLAFAAQTPIAVGSGPYDITVGDFDGDGKLDAATANDTDNNVTMLWGDGTGHLAAMNVSVPPTVNGCDPYALTSGRFNADTRDDIVVTCTDLDVHNHVYVLLGAANRSLTPTEITALASTGTMITKPEGVEVGDFNHDGKLDVAIANAGVQQIWIVNGNGDGTFATTTSSRITSGQYPTRVVAGDFNHDGLVDLAAGDYNVPNVYVYLQASAGGFATVATYNTTGSVNGMAVGDLDANVHDDIITADANNNAVDVLLADTTGAFPTAMGTKMPPAYPAHATPSSVAVGDFNKDGKLDVVCANANNPGGSIDVLLGKGDGTLDSAISLGNSPTPISVRVGDFNGDGLPDLIVSNNLSGTPTATVYLNTSHP